MKCPAIPAATSARDPQSSQSSFSSPGVQQEAATSSWPPQHEGLASFTGAQQDGRLSGFAGSVWQDFMARFGLWCSPGTTRSRKAALVEVDQLLHPAVELLRIGSSLGDAVTDVIFQQLRFQSPEG